MLFPATMLTFTDMETIIGILPYIQVALAILLIIAVLMQQSAVGLGAGFGGDTNASETFSTRRGIEKTFFNATIVIAILFVLTTIAPLMLT